MITKKGKRVVFTNDKVKAERESLEAATNKHKGKPITSLTKKELESLLAVTLKILKKADNGEVIK